MLNNIYTYEEMQERIADYCLGKLNNEEIILFEKSIPHYTELRNEIEEMQSAFSTDYKSVINDDMERKARNLSVRVNDKLANVKISNVTKYLKYIAPVLGVVLLFFIIRQTNIDIPLASEQVISEQDIDEITADVNNSDELLQVIDENDNYDEFSSEVTIDDIGYDADEVYDDIVIDDFFADIENNIEELNGLDLTEDDIYSIFNQIDNEEFEQILKEFQDVKIVS